MLSLPAGLLLSGRGRDGAAGVPARPDVKLGRALSRGVRPAAARAAAPSSSAAARRCPTARARTVLDFPVPAFPVKTIRNGAYAFRFVAAARAPAPIPRSRRFCSTTS